MSQTSVRQKSLPVRRRLSQVVTVSGSTTNRRATGASPNRGQGELDTIRRMWTLMLTGTHSPRAIWETAVDTWGLRNRWKAGHPITLTTTYKIFGNRFYAGIIERGGKAYQGKHEPMITLAEFERVQSLLGRPGRPRPKHRQFAFTGKLRCGECGYAVTAEEKTNRFGSRYAYYHCTKKRLDVRCQQPCVRLEDLEDQIVDRLSEITVPEKLHCWARRKMEREATRGRETLDAKRAALSREKDSLTWERQNLLTLRTRELIQDAEFVAERARLDREIIRLDRELTELGKATSWFEPGRMLHLVQ